jgi:hypothetical protein
MYSILRKYNRKLLAVATVGLTIAFFVPQFSKTNRTPEDITIGKIGDTSINAAEVQNARAEWNMLRSTIVLPGRASAQGRPQDRPVAELLGETAFRQIEEHEAMFLLLLKEAQAMGAGVSQRELEAAMGQVNVRLPDGRIVPADRENLGEDTTDMVQEALKDLLSVVAARDRAASVVKISQPLVNNRLATEAQEIKLQLIPFAASDYMSKVPAPSTEALQAQFEKYADVLPAEFNANDTDPTGFGYKYPDRVKLQYIAVSREQVRAATKGSKSDYDWEVEAQRYYKKHGNLFPVTQPSSRPSDPLTLNSTGKSSPATGPTTKPFEQVRAQIIDALVEPQVEKAMQDITTRITATMASDYGQYRAQRRPAGSASASSAPATGPTSAAPTTAPTTGPGASFESFEYLQQLAAQVQKEFKVLPTVVSLGESFLDGRQLQRLPGIGTSFTEIRQSYLPFALYAIGMAAPLRPNAVDALQLFETSRPLTSMDQSTTYIFRLTAADAAHKPSSLSEVAEQVTRDVKLTEALKLARADAQNALAAAKASGLRQAALSAGKTPIETGFFGADTTRPIPGFEVSEESRRAFTADAFKLLGAAAADPKSPAISTIELPRDGKILVAQLADLKTEISSALLPQAQRQAVDEIAEQLRRPLYDRWFTFDNVKQRLNFVDESHGSKKPATAE